MSFKLIIKIKIKQNNHLKNLEYVTASENIIHSYSTVVHKAARRVKQFDSNNQFVKEYESMTKASRETGCYMYDIRSSLKNGVHKGGYRWEDAI